MALTAGTRVGPYEVIAALGAGGMGEVYRARDTRLKREVAVKVLTPSLAADLDRLARLQREAEVLASLNHPHIAAIYGLEEAGGVKALVMELVDGEDLSARIRRGPLPIDEVLSLARQIAAALEAAHERGIIHRDLKPANIKVRPDGTVKVLDFGLAKALEPAGVAASDAAESPTITSLAMTGVGVILGTAAYMSPEQARGKRVDTRADIWAFGCVLFEMVTGQRAFEGESVSETLARVIEREPDWARLPKTVSPALSTCLALCLQKEPGQRMRSIGDVRLILDGAFDMVVPPPAAPTVGGRWRHRAMVGVAAIVGSGVIIGTLIWAAMRPPESVPLRVSRLQVTSPGATALSMTWNDRDLAITPDGSRIVYVGNRGTQLFVRALDSLDPVAVFTGTPRGLFVSPDGQWIGFSDGRGMLKKVAVTGGPALTLATFDTTGPFGATWGPEDSIILATADPASGLLRVAAADRSITVVTRPDREHGEADHFWPEMLPDGRGVLYTITALTGGLDAAQVAVLDLQTGTRRVLVRGGSHAHYVSSGPASPTRAGGHLVYAAGGTLRAVPFDLAGLETRGPSVMVVPDVVTTGNGGVNAVVSGNGTLAYAPRNVEGTRTLVWVDRQGRETPVPAPPRPYLLPALSPDGTRVSMFVNDEEYDLWIWDFGRKTLARFTATSGVDGIQVWTADGRRMIFSSERAGARNFYSQAGDGTGVVERLTNSPKTQYPSAVLPDGRRLIFTEEAPTTGNDVMVMDLDGSRRVTPLVQSPFNERNGIVSPDGRWLAYEANESGPFEIHVRPFPDVSSGHWQVSTTGGTRPIWARSGRELIYVSPTGALMQVEVTRGPSWAATTPTVVVKEGYYTNPSWWGKSYDVSSDGERFLMLKEDTSTVADGAKLIVVLNWFEELNRRAANPEGLASQP